LHELQDRLAAAQIDLDRRDDEIQQLNEELDLKVQDHEKEIDELEGEWRDEALEARNQVDELKDVGSCCSCYVLTLTLADCKGA
jgi:hypothetical protein